MDAPGGATGWGGLLKGSAGEGEVTDQDRMSGGVVSPVHGRGGPVAGAVPEQRGPAGAELLAAGVPVVSGRPGRLRVDARRNLESVLRAAREVFGELGYDAPMEEVARRAGVGVGTVYRRFPSKEVLVRRIAAEEVAWLTGQARESLYGGGAPWQALADFLGRAVESGAGRLLPPEAFRYAAEAGRVPGQRGADGRAAEGAAELPGSAAADSDPRLLLQLVAALVARAGAAGDLRPGVTVSDVVLVLTAAVPVHATSAGAQPVPDEAAGSRAAESGADAGTDAGTVGGQPGNAPRERLLQILLQGLQGHRAPEL